MASMPMCYSKIKSLQHPGIFFAQQQLTGVYIMIGFQYLVGPKPLTGEAREI
jgi:hypothetical protein